MAWMRAPGVMYEVIDGKAMLIDSQGQELITLNPVGTLVWKELDGTHDHTALAATLIGRVSNVSPANLERDIAAFLQELDRAGLVAEDHGR